MAAAALRDGDCVLLGVGAGEWCRLRLIDQAATPTAARTSTITTAMTARAAVERSPGGLRPPPGRPPPGRGCGPCRGRTSGDGYGLVGVAAWAGATAEENGSGIG